MHFQLDVNGPTTHPLYSYLKKKTGGTEIGWNFFKFLVVDGEPIRRYQSSVKPKDIVRDILPILSVEADEL
jgi:glutathione peroxidase